MLILDHCFERTVLPDLWGDGDTKTIACRPICFLYYLSFLASEQVAGGATAWLWQAGQPGQGRADVLAKSDEDELLLIFVIDVLYSLCYR